MTWSELYRLASDAQCELLLLDSCLAALANSNDAALHARLTAEVPTSETLCAVLDEHRVPTTHQVEGALVTRYWCVESAPPGKALLFARDPVLA